LPNCLSAYSGPLPFLPLLLPPAAMPATPPPFLPSSPTEDLPAIEIPPFALPPFWELWGGKGPVNALKEAVSVKQAEKRRSFATSQDLFLALVLNSSLRLGLSNWHRQSPEVLLLPADSVNVSECSVSKRSYLAVVFQVLGPSYTPCLNPFGVAMGRAHCYWGCQCNDHSEKR
jgi:hypothetical protein